MPKGRKGRRRRKATRRSGLQIGAIGLVRSARRAAKKALDQLREEISSARSTLEELLSEERSFRAELSGGTTATGSKNGRRARRGRPRTVRRKGPPKADRFFKRLSSRFTLEDVRKVAGRLSGISLAQWARAGKVKKTAAGYEKVA